MIIYGKHQSQLNKSFLIRKFKSSTKYWDYKLYSDHLSKKDYFSLIKSLSSNKKIIYFSLESNQHSWKYLRPNKCDFRISHLGKNSLYYNLLVNELLSDYFTELKENYSKDNSILFISSNFNKISKLFKYKSKIKSKVKLFGLFGEEVPQKTDNFYLNAQLLYSKYKSAICLENSEEFGYMQGSYVPVLMSKTVPIIINNIGLIKKILKPECFIPLDNHFKLDDIEFKNLIEEKLDFIFSNDINNCFTSIFQDYISFIKDFDVNDLDNAIATSQGFKRRFFKEFY